MNWTAEKQNQLCGALERNEIPKFLESCDQAMLHYTDKLNRFPEAISADDVDELRKHGFDDRAIHDICCIAAYYAFVNRVADGLGVQLEREFE